MNIGTRIPILSLVLWTSLLLLLSKFLLGLPALAILGLTPLLGSASDAVTVWMSILRIAVGALILGAILLAFHRWVFSRLGLPKFEFLLWSWAPAVGAWIALERCVRGVEADWVARIEPLLLTWVLPLGLVGMGRAIGKPLGLFASIESTSRSPHTQYLLVSSLIGATAGSFLLFILSLAGKWNVWTLWAPVFVMSILGVLWLRRDLPQLAIEGAKAGSPKPEACAILFAILLILTATVQLSFLPPDESDELRYHLSIPKRYLEAGGRVEIPDRSFAHFPLGMEMLFAPPTSLDELRSRDLRLGLVGGSKFVHAWFFFLCMMTVYLATRELSDTDPSFWGPLVFASIGFAPVLAAWAFVDFGAAFGWLASIFFTWIYFRKDADSQRSKFAMVGLTAIALGWGLMVKYTSLAWWFLLVVFWSLVSFARRRPQVKALAILVFLPSLLVLPWLILNWIETGNPFYPLLASVFGAGFDAIQKGFYDWHAGMKGNLNGFWDLSPPQKLFDLIWLPFNAALHPQHFENNPIGGLIPCLFPAFLLGLWNWRGERVAIASLTLALFLLWGLTYRDPRFAIPLWGVYATFAGAGLSSMLEALPAFGRMSALRFVIVGFLLFFSMGQSDEIFRRSGNYREWIVWAKAPDDYLRSRFPFHDTVREVERLRKLEPEPPTLLLLGMEQSYYFDSPLRGADYFDGPWLAGLAREASDVEGISEKIRSQGIDWIFANRDTLETNDSNVARGALFCLDLKDAEGTLAEARKKNFAGLPYTPAFRRMHAWLIRHPGFEEIPLETSPSEKLPVSNYYRTWMDWPELKGLSMEDLPRRHYSLLVPLRSNE